MTSVECVDFDLRKQIEIILQDAYIQKCIGQVEFPETIVQMLEILFSNTSFDESKKKHLGVAATLLQMGLEMHAQASSDQSKTPRMRTRQQLVLAGDYYSSLFYRFLVQHEEFSLINYFCKNILLINEAKLSLHVKLREQKKYDMEMLANHKKVTSGLLLAVADYFRSQEDFIFLWKKTISMSLLLNDLKKSGIWQDFPPSLKQRLYQEWNELQLEMDRLEEGPKQQLLSLLYAFESFIQKFALKES